LRRRIRFFFHLRRIFGLKWKVGWVGYGFGDYDVILGIGWGEVLRRSAQKW
jgi:hypothetical protein